MNAFRTASIAIICGIAYGIATHYAWSQTVAPPQSVPTESEILGGIVSQQAQANARLTVRLIEMEQAIAREKARADASEAKQAEMAKRADEAK